MLSKIINIHAGSDFKHSGSKGFYSQYENFKHESSNPHDSVVLSPAVQFIKLINWKLKELSFFSKEKLFISFQISEFEFHTIIDYAEIKNNALLEFNIIKEFSDKGKEKLVAGFFYFLSKSDNEPHSISADLDEMRILFSRMEDLNIKNELSREDCELLNSLFDGIYEGITKTFKIISDNLFTFIERLTELKIEIPETINANSAQLNKIKIMQ
jgi:hypothetical protein